MRIEMVGVDPQGVGIESDGLIDALGDKYASRGEALRMWENLESLTI